MNRTILLGRRTGKAMLLGSLFLAVTQIAGAEDDLSECRQRLHIMGQAVAVYRHDHDGQFPKALGALFPRYLSNALVLKCPAALRSGESGPANPGLVSPSGNDGRVVGYNWEMSLDDPSLWAGQTIQMSFYEFKRLQLESLVGKNVPIIRCTHHGPERVLNLTSNGQIYESGDDYWECNFVDVISGSRLAPELVRMAHLPMSELVRPRPPNATDAMPDLRSHYNARFEDPWIHADMGEEWPDFAKALNDGLLTSRGINFDPAGMIQLNGMIVSNERNGYTRLTYPTNVPPIEVKRAFRVMHVLGGVVFESPANSIVGRIEFYRGDGSRLATWEWKYGADVEEVIYRVTREQLPSEKLHVAWIGETGAGPSSGKRARLFHLHYVNPEPDTVVSEIRFLPGDTASSPFIAAITLQP